METSSKAWLSKTYFIVHGRIFICSFSTRREGKKNTYIALLVLQRMQKRTTFLFRVLQPLLLLLSNGFSFLPLSLSLSLCVYVLRSYKSATTLFFSLGLCSGNGFTQLLFLSLSLYLSIHLWIYVYTFFSLQDKDKCCAVCVVLSLFLSLSLSFCVTFFSLL